MSSMSTYDYQNDKITIFYDSNENFTRIIQNITSINDNDLIFILENNTASDY